MRILPLYGQEKQQKSFGATLVYNTDIIRPSTIKNATQKHLRQIDKFQKDALVVIKREEAMLEDINEEELPTFIATIKKAGSGEPAKELARSNEVYFDGFITLVAKKLKRMNKQRQKEVV